MINFRSLKKLAILHLMGCPQIQFQVNIYTSIFLNIYQIKTISGALSSSRLNEVGTNQNESYGATYSTVGGNLGVPGANPFAQQQQQQMPTNGFSNY